MFQYYSFPYPGQSPVVPTSDTPPPPGGRCRPCTPATIQSVGGTALHECRVCGAAWRRNASCEFVRDPSADAPVPPPRRVTFPRITADDDAWEEGHWVVGTSPFSVAECREIMAAFSRQTGDTLRFIGRDGVYELRRNGKYRRIVDHA